MLGLVFVSICVARPVVAQSTLVDETHTIAAPDQAVPVEHSFVVTTAGTYNVALTDLGKAASPSAPLTSIKLAISSGNAIVGTPLIGEGTTQFNATAGTTYVVRVIGMPGNVAQGSGPFGVQITNAADNSVLADGSFSDTLSLPPAAAPTVSVLNDTFTVQSADTYQVSLTDLSFPQRLGIAELALTGSGNLLATLSVQSSSAAAQSGQAALQPNTTYSVFAFGQTGSVNAGLYNVVVRDSQANVVYSKTLAVGTLQALGAVNLTAGSYNLGFTDLQFPHALSTTGVNGAVVTLDDQVQTQLTATGSRAFNATAGNNLVFSVGTADATAMAGSYDVELLPTSGAPVLDVAQAVVAAGSTLQGYAFNAPITAAGSYTVQLADYQYPVPTTSLQLLAEQGGQPVATALAAAGTATVPAAAGPMPVVVFAGAGAGGSVFGVFVTPSGGGSPVLEATQGVGALFASQKFTVATAGSYSASLTDLGFPSPFGSLYMLVTQGPTLVGSIFGGGALPFTAAAGTDYFVIFTAQPSGPDKAGTYAVSVGPPPPAPVITFSAAASEVASGGNTTLTWSTQNATSCTATSSGGWSGAQPLSGTFNTGALTAATTYTLKCTGSGGSATQSVTVSIAKSGSSRGGGPMQWPEILVMACILLIKRARSVSDERR